jgi:hypothetical protein
MNDGDLCQVDPVEATNVLFSKWVINAFELGDSNLQKFIRFLRASSLALKNLRYFTKVENGPLTFNGVYK